MAVAAGQEENCRPVPGERERNSRVVFWGLATVATGHAHRCLKTHIQQQQLFIEVQYTNRKVPKS